MPFSDACERNKDPILQVLRPALASHQSVLEIGSGTGQHAVHCAAAMPWLRWQPTDRAEWIESLREVCTAAGLPNLQAPVLLDVAQSRWPDVSADALFTANTLHIMSWQQVRSLFSALGTVLRGAAPSLLIYGPFRYRDAFTTDSNATFDKFLRARDPLSGIRDFEAVDALAHEQGFRLAADHDMPANNQLLHWARSG
jgi:hypothetical protein